MGGGPAGVAARRDVLVKVAHGIVVRVGRKAVRGIEAGRARASVAMDRAEAMVLCKEETVVAKMRIGDTNQNKDAVIG